MFIENVVYIKRIMELGRRSLLPKIVNFDNIWGSLMVLSEPVTLHCKRTNAFTQRLLNLVTLRSKDAYMLGKWHIWRSYDNLTIMFPEKLVW